MSMRNTFSHHQTTEPEVIQPTEHCIQMLMYIDILSSRVPSSPGTPSYHQLYVKSTPLTSYRQGQGPSPYQCYPRCRYVHSVFNYIRFVLAVQKGHARSQHSIQSILLTGRRRRRRIRAIVIHPFTELWNMNQFNFSKCCMKSEG